MPIIRIVICLALVASCVSATNITANMTVDDAFVAYISTDDTLTGAQIGSGTSWPTTVNFSMALTPGVTNYLHIVATDYVAPAMFIGDFTLSDTGFSFSNGTQFLVTNTTNWGVSATGFGGGYSTPVDEGGQGTSPWGSFASIDASARFIWSEIPPCGDCTRYFSTTITPNAITGVPEPSSVLLLGAGLALFSIGRRRLG